ncbi:hypothetical protein OROGR_032304 [Orobanche gracilis]
MGQQSLIYSFVARGAVILAEYTEFTGNFTVIAAQCLQKLPAMNNKFTYNCDGHTFNYLVEDGFTYCVVVVESAWVPAKEAVAWELFTPIQRVLTVAVVAAATADNSKKIKQISRLQNSVELRDQVLLGMQQKLDNLHEQVNYFKDQPEVRTQTDVFLTKRLECGCKLSHHHDQPPYNSLGLNAEEVAKCEVEPDECRMSDLSDWAPSVISSVDIEEDWDGICGHVFGALACEVEALGLFCRMNKILIKMMM